MNKDLDRLRLRLRRIRTVDWEELAEAAGCTASLPRKIVYEVERNFRPETYAPLVAHFAALDEKKAQRRAQMKRKREGRRNG